MNIFLDELWYIAGPMTGRENYNFPAFFGAEERLHSHGIRTVNPARHDEEEGWVVVRRDRFGTVLDVRDRDETGFDWSEALKWDLEQIRKDCTGLYLLPGWSTSRGATREVEAAQEQGLPLYGAVGETPARPVTSQPLIGLVGAKQAGKDTFANFLGTVDPSYNRIAFADPLKRLAVAADPEFPPPGGGPFDLVSDTWPLSVIVEGEGWEGAKRVPGVREFLQDLGVGVREELDEDAWVTAAFKHYDPTRPTVFTDVRFPNEIEAIRGRGGVIVRIDREGHEPADSHVSETAWQDCGPDFEFLFMDQAFREMHATARWLHGKLGGTR